MLSAVNYVYVYGRRNEETSNKYYFATSQTLKTQKSLSKYVTDIDAFFIHFQGDGDPEGAREGRPLVDVVLPLSGHEGALPTVHAEAQEPRSRLPTDDLPQDLRFLRLQHVHRLLLHDRQDDGGRQRSQNREEGTRTRGGRHHPDLLPIPEH